MIMVLVDAGYRALAPDLVGFGRSDKPTEMSDYSYRRHVDWMESWFEQIRVADVTLFCQDWGGLIGLRMVTERPDRFRRIAAANTGLPTGDAPPGEAFVRWQEFSQSVETFPVGPIVNGGCVTDLPAEVIAAYDAPFPDETYKAGARILPALVPTHPDDPAAPRNRAAWEKLRRWEKPFLTLFSDSDPITAGVDAVLRDRIPGAEGQPHVTIEGAGHFLQEDRGEEVARHLVDWMRRLDA
jgi:haloalkane dehalogenase